MNLGHLETFLAIYQHQNLSRASEELHISQAAVSNHLRALEGYLGRSLFVRQARGVVPTLLADSIANDITGPLQSLRETTTAYATGANLLDATVYIGGPADAMSAKVVPALQSLTARGLTLHASTGNTRELLESLSEGKLDLVIATKPSRQRGVRLEPFFTETLALIASPTWAGRIGEVTPEALKEAPMIAYAQDLQLIRRYWRIVFSRQPPQKPRIVLEDLRGIIQTVVADGGWTVMPTYLAAEALQSGTVQILHSPVDPPTNTLYLASANGHEKNSTLAAISGNLLAAAKHW